MNRREKYQDFSVEELVVLKISLHNSISTLENKLYTAIAEKLINEIIDEIFDREHKPNQGEWNV